MTDIIKSRKLFLFGNIVTLIALLASSFAFNFEANNAFASMGVCNLTWSGNTLSDGRGVRKIGETSDVAVDLKYFVGYQTVLLQNTNLNNGQVRSAPLPIDKEGNFYIYDRTPIRADEYGIDTYKTEVLDASHNLLATCNKSFVIISNFVPTPVCNLSWNQPTTSDSRGIRKIGGYSDVSISLSGFSPNSAVVIKNTNLNSGATRSAPVSVDGAGNFNIFDHTLIRADEYSVGTYKSEIVDASHSLLAACNKSFIIQAETTTTTTLAPTTTTTIPPTTTTTTLGTGTTTTTFPASTTTTTLPTTTTATTTTTTISPTTTTTLFYNTTTTTLGFAYLDIQQYGARNISRGESGFTQSVYGNKGDELEFYINVRNYSPIVAREAYLRINFPVALNLIPDSLILRSSRHLGIPSVSNPLGDIYPGEQQDVFFKARILNSAGNTEYTYVNITGSNFLSVTRNTNVFASGNTPTTTLSPAPNSFAFVSISKLGKNITHGDTNWLKTVRAEAGDTVQFSIMLTSSGNISAKDVRVSDSLGSNLAFIPGSVTNNSFITSDSVVSGSGLALGEIFPGEVRFVKFQARVSPSNNVLSQNGFINVSSNASVLGSNIPSVSDYANVYITRPVLPSPTTTLRPNSSINPNSPVVFVYPETVDVVKTGRNISRGQEIFTKQIIVYPGDEIEFNVQITSSVNKKTSQILVKDSMPEELDYIFNSIRMDNGLVGANIVREGIVLASLSPNESRNITYRARVLPKSELPDKNEFEIENTVSLRGENILQSEDSVNITIKLGGVSGLLGGLAFFGNFWLLLFIALAVLFALLLWLLLGEKRKNEENEAREIALRREYV